MTNTTELPALLEAILFFKGGSMTVKELSAASKASLEEVTDALNVLHTSLEGRGIRLVRERDSAGLATTPVAEEVIQTMRKEELEGPIGRAGLETLAVILYRGPLSRADIEYIRGVNASAILRTLMIRGLVERVDNPKDKRSFLYRASTELPAYLGVSQLSELPDFESVTNDLAAVFAERDVVPPPAEDNNDV